MSNLTKKCKHCGVEFIANRKDKIFCNEKCYALNYNKANKQRFSEYWKRRYEANKEKVKKEKKIYYEVNKEKLNERCRRYYKKTREKRLEYSKHYHEANRDKIIKSSRKLYYERRGYPEELLEIKELEYQIKKEIKNQQENN